MIPNFIIGDLMIDCADAKISRDFYADLMEWEKLVSYDCPAVKTGNGLMILFAEPEIAYAPPVWPEEVGKEQKQMHLDFTVDALQPFVDKAIGLGATKAAAQYGGEECVTMLDPEGRPFCFCKRHSESDFEKYFEKKGWGKIPDPSINIDCTGVEELRAFYAQLTNWDRDFHWTALIPENRMVVHFMGCDFEYVPPVWPEEPGRQQKQMHFNFQVDCLPSTVDEAIRLGAKKTIQQYGGERWVTLLDPEGHPFCLCARR